VAAKRSRSRPPRTAAHSRPTTLPPSRAVAPQYFPLPTCVLLNLGFGMPIPAWFLGGTQNGTVWFSRLAQPDPLSGGAGYVNTLWTQSPVPGEGNFDYFSFLNTSNGANAGDGHHFSGASPRSCARAGGATVRRAPRNRAPPARAPRSLAPLHPRAPAPPPSLQRPRPSAW
jgi:hypothetical protein